MKLTNDEFVRKLAHKMNTTEEDASQRVKAFTHTIYEILMAGDTVSIDDLGHFDINWEDDLTDSVSIGLNQNW